MTSFVEVSRDLLYDLTLPSLGVVLYGLAWVAATTVGAIVVYLRRGRDVSEAI